MEFGWGFSGVWVGFGWGLERWGSKVEFGGRKSFGVVGLKYLINLFRLLKV